MSFGHAICNFMGRNLLRRRKRTAEEAADSEKTADTLNRAATGGGLRPGYAPVPVVDGAGSSTALDSHCLPFRVTSLPLFPTLQRLQFRVAAHLDTLPALGIKKAPYTLAPDRTLKVDGVEFIPGGMGSFGKVYRYEYGRQKRAVKIKVRKAGQEMADDLDFTSEVNALCRLADSPHPNVMVGFQLTLFDTWVRTGVAAVEMAFYPCSGDQVGPIPGDYQLKTVRYAAVIREIASGLNHLHRHNIIHKDLKPQNILIGSDGHCVIADYGSSVDTQDNKLSYTQSGQILEYGNSIVTTGFVAPEILFVGNGGFATYDSKVDVWSLGMTIYSLITGWMAPAQYISHAVLGLDGSNRMRSEMEKRGCPQPVQALVLTMCQINPEHRMNCLDIITVADMLLKHEDKDPAKLEAPFVVEYVAQEEGDDGQEYNPLWNLTPPNPAASTGIMEFGRLLKKYRPRL